MAWEKKVGRHVTVLKRVSATVVKPKPGVITALGAGELITARVGHQGETYVNIDRRFNPTEAAATTKYISY